MDKLRGIVGVLFFGRIMTESINKRKKPRLSSELFVRSEGFEPSTLGAEIRYSIQLNYERKMN